MLPIWKEGVLKEAEAKRFGDGGGGGKKICHDTKGGEGREEHTWLENTNIGPISVGLNVMLTTFNPVLLLFAMTFSLRYRFV